MDELLINHRSNMLIADEKPKEVPINSKKKII